MNTLYPYKTNMNTIIFAQLIKEEIKKEIMSELLAHQEHYFASNLHQNVGKKAYDKPFGDLNAGPFVRSMEKALLEEPNASFYINKEEESGRIGENILTGLQGRGVLYGIGTMALMGMLLPPFGKKIQTVLARAASEGMELISKANL